MKKVLIAFDGTQFSEGAFNFALELNELSPILLTGVFVPQVSFANLWSYTGAMAGAAYIPMIEEEEGEQVQKNIEHFKFLCTRNNISFRVHKDYNDFALPELARETRFADLLVLSSEKFFENIIMSGTEEYMREAVHAAECPVIVIPENFCFPKRNIIAYDGSATSVFALKQFAYIFPELTDNETLLVYAKDEDEVELPCEDLVEELASQHYKDLDLLKLRVNPKTYFSSWLENEERPILISGSYGRSGLSSVFKKSFVASIVYNYKIPVFIAHQ